EVVDARGAEVPLDPAPGAVVVAEEGERRPGGADDRPNRLAALVGEDGAARRLVRQQHVEPGASQRRRGAAADPSTARDPPGGLWVDPPQRPAAPPPRWPGDVAVAAAAQPAIGVDREAFRASAGAPLPRLQDLEILVIAGGEPQGPGARLVGE